jgi:hypothetical protein
MARFLQWYFRAAFYHNQRLVAAEGRIMYVSISALWKAR